MLTIALAGLALAFGLAWIRAIRAARIARAARRELGALQAPLFAAFARLLARLPGDGPAPPDRVLAELACGFGADRAYVLAEEADGALLRWARPGTEWPAGWPDTVRDAALAATAGGDILNRAGATGRGADALAIALGRAAVARWCAIPLVRQDAGRAVLALDRLAPGPDWQSGEDAPVRIAGQMLAVALHRDRAGLEAERMRARRLEAIGAFATGVTHNINNVVGAVMGHVEMALEAGVPGTAISHHLREIARAGERAQEMVESIMQFGTAHGASRAEPLEVGRLLEGIVSMVRVTIPPTIEFVLDAGRGEPTVRGNAAQLQQIFINLIRNACQAIEGSGRVAVSVATETVEAPRTLSHDVLPPGEHVRFAVSDTGCGMSAAVLASVFEPFFTTKPGGAGLGLATVRETVQDHGGALDVVSARGRGSVFTVWLPAAGPEAAAPVARGSGEGVLLVSLDETQLRRDEETVAALGYEPRGVASIEAASRLVAADPQAFIAALLAARTVGGAAEAVRRVRARTRLPVVLITERPDNHPPGEIEGIGIDVVLSRPLSSVSLAASLSRCASRAGRMSAAPVSGPE